MICHIIYMLHQFIEIRYRVDYRFYFYISNIKWNIWYRKKCYRPSSNNYVDMYISSRDICDPKSPVAEWILCPTRQCEAGFCGFTRVLDTCGLYRWTSAATFDRPGSVAFAVFMSFWGESNIQINLSKYNISEAFATTD